MCLKIGVSINGSLDTLATSLMNISCWQIQVLKDNLQNISDRACVNLFGEEEVDKEKINFTDREMDDEIYGILKSCVRHHLMIAEYNKTVRNLAAFF